MPRLENWEYDCGCLYGNVYEDERFDDGLYVKTSTIKLLNLEDMTAKTLNTLYTLGKRKIEAPAAHGTIMVTKAHD